MGTSAAAAGGHSHQGGNVGAWRPSDPGGPPCEGPGQVMERAEVVKDGCEGECGTLYLEIADGTEVDLKGTQTQVKVKGVQKDKVDGTEIHNLKEEGVSWTTVKSIEYSADCIFKVQAGVEVYVIVAVVTLVVLVAGAVVAWAKLRTQHNPQPDNAETP